MARQPPKSTPEDFWKGLLTALQLTGLALAFLVLAQIAFNNQAGAPPSMCLVPPAPQQ